MVWQDTDAALFKLRSFADKIPDARTIQLNSRAQLDTGYQRGWFSAQARTVVDLGYSSGD